MRSDRPIIALFCGSRDWTDREKIRRDLRSLPEGSLVVEGDRVRLPARRAGHRAHDPNAEDEGITVQTRTPPSTA